MPNIIQILRKIALLFLILFIQQKSFSQVANYLNFNGTSNFVAVNAPFIGFTNQITVECWVNPTTKGGTIVTQALLSTDSWNSNQFVFYLEGSNQVSFSTNNNGNWITCTTSSALPLNSWSHVVGVTSPSGTFVYINGVIQGTQPGISGAILNNSTNQIYIGRDVRYPISGNPFYGGIDELRIWNVALNSTDINRTKNCELQGNETGLVEYYKFNQGIAGGTNTSVTTLNDAAATPHNGTLTSFVLSGSTSNWVSGSQVTTGSTVPSAPTATAQSFCGTTTVANLVPAPSSTNNWYSASTGGTALPAATALATGTYYVTAANANGCESPRTSVAITVNSLPSAPNASVQSFCGSATVSNLVPAPSTNIKWYTTATGGTALPTTTALATGTYYVDSTNSSGCVSSSRTSVSVTVNALPPSPTASAQTFCGSATVANLIPAPSNNIKWYTSATGGTALPTSTALASGTYYVDSTNSSGCVSSSRTSVGVTINALPTVNSISNQTVCNGTATTAINFTGTASTYKWTNNNTSIGLAANGTGNIPSFSAINLGNSSATATVTVTPASTPPFAYIADSSTNNVSVINTVTNTVVATIAVGTNPRGVTVTPDGSKVYVSNYGSNNVSVIATATNTVIATVAVGTQPLAVAVSPDGSKVFVSNSAGTNTHSETVISTATNTVIANVSSAGGYVTYGLAYSPDNSKVYAAVGFGGSQIWVINTSTYSYNTIGSGLGTLTYGLAISPDGSKLYATNYGSNNVSVINTTTNAVTNTITVGNNPVGISVSPDGSKIYVANYGSNNITVINSTNNSIIGTISVGTGPKGISVSPDGTLVYVANYGSNNVSIINTSTNTVVNTLTVGTNPVSLGNFITNPLVCTGTPQTFSITVNATPPAPSASAQSFCNGAIVSNLVPASSANTKWYTTATGGTALPTTTVLATGTYYVDSTNSSGCVSSSRTSVSVTLNALPQAPTATAQTFCGSATVANLVPAANSNVNWYTTATGGTALPTSTALATTTYYVDSTNGNGCVSSSRTSVGVTVNPLPTVNTISNQTVCNGAATTAVNFTGTANTYTWTNNNTTNGLTASGIGNIPSFTATNTGSSVLTTLLTVTPKNQYEMAYVANNSSNNVSVINTTNNTLITTIGVGIAPYAISVSHDGSRVYVVNSGDNTISIINTATNLVTATINVGSGPAEVAVSPDGNKVYVTNFNDNTISVINSVTNTVIATVAVGKNPRGVCVSLDGTKVFVSNFNDPSVSVINAVTNTVINTIIVGSNPYVMCISPDGTKVYVTNSLGFGSISVINAINNTLTNTISVGSYPSGVSVSQDGTKVYVSNKNNNTLSVINTANNTVTATVSVGSGPISLGNFIASLPACTGTPQTFTITVNPSSNATLAMANTTQAMLVNSTTYFSNGCTDNLITNLNPSGSNPVSGSTTASVWIESSQPASYVRRHYEITPANNASTSTGTITLYFSQADFDAFNNQSFAPALKLPTGPSNATGISNLLVEKRGGVSSDGTGLPGTYSGSITTINPTDANIVWNNTYNRWEVTFDVTSFSGFFVKTASTPLPLNLLSFNGSRQGTNNNLFWQTANEVNTQEFDIERSNDGINFNKIGVLTAKGSTGNYYSYSDIYNSNAAVYYRLKIMDNNNSFTYSNIILLSSNMAQQGVSVYPNPVKNNLTIKVTNNNLLQTKAKLIDATGKILKMIMVNSLTENVSVENLSSGLYLLEFVDGTNIKLIKE